MQASSKLDPAARQLLSGTLLEDSGEGKLSSPAPSPHCKLVELQAVYLVLYFSWQKKWPGVQYIIIHGLGPIVWLDGHRVRNNMIRKWVRKFRKRYVETFLNGQNTKDMKICLSRVNVHQRATSLEEDFKKQVDRKTCSVDMSASFPSHPCHGSMDS